MPSINLQSYVKAMIPNQYMVMGVKLRPFSLGHYFLMKKYDCGFVDEDENRQGGFDDILLAIAVCSRTYEEFLEWKDSPKDFDDWCKEWSRQVKKAIKKDTINILYEVNNFKNYMKDSIMIPKVWNKNDNEGSSSNAHWTQNVYNILLSKMNYPESRVLNMPLSQALFDFYKYLENEGVVEFWNDYDLIEWEKKQDTINA